MQLWSVVGRRRRRLSSRADRDRPVGSSSFHPDDGQMILRYAIDRLIRASDERETRDEGKDN